MNFGCIPIVSEVGSIGHYFKNGIEGFILGKINCNELTKSWENFNDLTKEKKDSFIFESNKLAHMFTFEKYLTNLKKRVINGF